jgi:hypothetical protein
MLKIALLIPIFSETFLKIIEPYGNITKLIVLSVLCLSFLNYRIAILNASIAVYFCAVYQSLPKNKIKIYFLTYLIVLWLINS